MLELGAKPKKMVEFETPKPVGNCLLIEIEPREDKALKSQSVYIPEEIMKAANQKAVHSTSVGLVAALGPKAFTTLPEDAPRCMVGDYILFVSNAGIIYQANDKNYLIIKEGDVLAVVGQHEELTTEDK